MLLLSNTHLARSMSCIQGNSTFNSKVFLLNTSILLTFKHITALSSALGRARNLDWETSSLYVKCKVQSDGKLKLDAIKDISLHHFILYFRSLIGLCMYTVFIFLPNPFHILILHIIMFHTILFLVISYTLIPFFLFYSPPHYDSYLL